MSDPNWAQGADPETDDSGDTGGYTSRKRLHAMNLSSEALLEPIKHLQPRAAICVGASDSITSVLEKMTEASESCVLVMKDELIVGIFTERDVLMRLHTPGPHGTEKIGTLDQIPIKEVMTPDPEMLEQSDSLAFALNKMAVGGYRHIPILPVVAEDGTAGSPCVLSVRYLVSYLADYFPDIVYNLPPSPNRKDTHRYGG